MLVASTSVVRFNYSRRQPLANAATAASRYRAGEGDRNSDWGSYRASLIRVAQEANRLVSANV
jgi:hypothetical protein